MDFHTRTMLVSLSEIVDVKNMRLKDLFAKTDFDVICLLANLRLIKNNCVCKNCKKYMKITKDSSYLDNFRVLLILFLHCHRYILSGYANLAPSYAQKSQFAMILSLKSPIFVFLNSWFFFTCGVTTTIINKYVMSLSWTRTPWSIISSTADKFVMSRCFNFDNFCLLFNCFAGIACASL